MSNQTPLITTFETEYVLPFTEREVNVRKKVVYTMLNYMGIELKPEDINLRMVYATRFIPVRLLMSAFVVAKLMDGWTTPQIIRKYPVTDRNVRTIKELLKAQRKRVVEYHKTTFKKS